MARWTRTEEEDPPDDWEDEYTHPDDIEYDPEDDDAFNEFTKDESPEIPCPHCGEMITEDHLRCPHCEMYLSSEDAPPEKKSRFVYVMLGLTLLSIFLFWIMT